MTKGRLRGGVGTDQCGQKALAERGVLPSVGNALPCSSFLGRCQERACCSGSKGKLQQAKLSAVCKFLAPLSLLYSASLGPVWKTALW